MAEPNETGEYNKNIRGILEEMKNPTGTWTPIKRSALEDVETLRTELEKDTEE